MFTINVGDLLASYAGDSRELVFSGEVIPGFYDDLRFTKSLEFRIKLIGLDNGIEVIFETLDSEVEYEWAVYPIHLESIARTFQERHDPLAPDDIGLIDMRGSTIDLKDAIREEILISIL